jgi:hypothetical protein
MLNRSLTALVIGAGLALCGFARADPAEGLIGHWTFDDCTAKDVSGGGLDGTIEGPVECVRGQHSKALKFTTTGAVKLPPVQAVFDAGFSGCAWASYADNTVWGSLFDFGNGPYIDNIALIRSGTSEQLLYFYESSFVANGGRIHNGRWQFYCVTVDNPRHTAKVYINAKKVAFNRQHTLANVARSSNFLGNNNWGEQFRGTLGDVRVWNRPLSADEVMQVYLADPH